VTLTRRAIGYRVGQGLRGLLASAAPPDDAPARRLLPSALFDLFQGMAAADRAHALSVLADLEARGEQDPILLQAALLHDVGKAEPGITLVHRTLRVLLAHRASRLWDWLSGGADGWRRPLWVLARHPARGADAVAARGAAPDLVAIIRLHEAPMPAAWQGTEQGRRHAMLTTVDARH